MEYYTREQIAKEFEKLSNPKKAEVLFSAIDYALQHNGRSKFLCIAMAMGYDNYEGENDTYFKK